MICVVIMLSVPILNPKNIIEAEGDTYWLLAIQEELNQFERNQVWHLIPRPHDRPESIPRGG